MWIFSESPTNLNDSASFAREVFPDGVSQKCSNWINVGGIDIRFKRYNKKLFDRSTFNICCCISAGPLAFQVRVLFCLTKPNVVDELAKLEEMHVLPPELGRSLQCLQEMINGLTRGKCGGIPNILYTGSQRLQQGPNMLLQRKHYLIISQYSHCYIRQIWCIPVVLIRSLTGNQRKKESKKSKAYERFMRKKIDGNPENEQNWKRISGSFSIRESD